MSLKDLIRTQTLAGPNSVFRQVDADGKDAAFGEEDAEFFGRDCDAPTIEHVLVDYGGLQGSNESHGDGMRMNDTQGVAERQTVVVDVRPDLPVRDVQPTQGADYFVLGKGTPYYGKYVVRRKLGVDEGEMSLLCARTDQGSMRHLRRNG